MSSPPLTVAVQPKPQSFFYVLLSTLPFSSSIKSLYIQYGSTVRQRWYLIIPLVIAFSILNRRLLIRPSTLPASRPPSPPPLHRGLTAPVLTLKRRRPPLTHTPPTNAVGSAPSSPTLTFASSSSATSSATARRSHLRFLSQTKYIACFGESHLQELYGMMRWRGLQADELLIVEGDEVELGMWIVAKGSIGIFQPDAECQLPTSTAQSSTTAHYSITGTGSPMCVIEAGESIGEWALIGHFPNLSTHVYPVRAASLSAHTECFFLSRSAFVAFTRRHPRALMEFVRTAVARQWRIASYVLEHVLELPSRSREEVQGDEQAARVDWEEVGTERAGVATATEGRAELGSAPGTVPADGSYHPAASSASPTPLPPPLSSPAMLEASHPPPSPASPLPPFAKGRGARLITLSPHEALFNVGDDAHSLYVVCNGSLQAIVPATPSSAVEVTGIIPVGCVCGGISFMGSTSRGETIRAGEHTTTLLEYTRETVDALMADDPSSLLPIARAVGRQLAPICQQFFELGLDSRWYRAGSIVYEEAEGSDAVYLIISGRVHAVVSQARRSGNDGERRSVAGEIVFGEPKNDEDDAAGVDERGRADGEQVYETLFEVGRGETLGEETSFGDGADDVKRPYTAVCVRDTECVRISQSTFMHLFNLNPRSMLRFARSLSHRVHQLASRSLYHSASSPSPTRPSPPPIATIALVWVGAMPWGGPRSFILSFGERLMRELSTHGPCIWVDEGRLRREVGDGTADALGDVMHRSRASRWLSELEENHRFIVCNHVLETTQPSETKVFGMGLTGGVRASGPSGERWAEGEEGDSDEVTAWTRLCVEQADCVLLLCSAESEDVSITRYEEELLWSTSTAASASPPSSSDDEDNDRVDVRLNRYKDLVILHRTSSTTSLPTHTAQTLHKRPVRSHHHIRREVQPDYARLARFLAGESVGVVLGGGGARGLAHVGVLQALEEEGIPIDCIAGCSQGAFIAALYAKHLSVEGMMAEVTQFAKEFTTWGFLRDATFPLLSYFNGHHFSRVVREAVGDSVMIEDLWLNFFCVSTNVRRSDVQVHRSGLLWRYCRASMTLLGFLPPVVDDNGDILLDGGYGNNLPVDVITAPPSYAHTVIAVDVEDKDLSVFDGLTHLARRKDYGMSISGLWLLWNKLFGGVKVPDFRSILVYLACLNHSRQLRLAGERRLIDVYIRPRIEGYQLLDYLKFNEIIASGYEDGKRTIREWKSEMRRISRQAREEGQDEEEVVEELQDGMEEKAAQDIKDGLRRMDGLTPRRSSLKQHDKAADMPIDEEKRLSGSDNDDADADTDDVLYASRETSVSSSHTRSPNLIRALSEPSSMDALPATQSLSFLSSAASSQSSMHSPRPHPPTFQRNPSMRMLRAAPTAAQRQSRGGTKTIKGVLRAQSRKGRGGRGGGGSAGSATGMRVGWASEESMRRRDSEQDGSIFDYRRRASTDLLDGDGEVRFARSASQPMADEALHINVGAWPGSEGS